MVACAEAWRGDGEVLASPMGAVPSLGARLARRTFDPDLLLTDGEAMLVGARTAARRGLAAVPQASGDGRRRAAARDDGREPDRPLRQPEHLLHRRLGAARPAAARGARRARSTPSTTRSSYWVPKHSTRVFVERVDMVSGVGVRQRGRGRSRGDPLPPHPPGRHRPGRVRLRDPGPHACGCASRASRGDASRRSWRRPGSSWRLPTRSRTPGSRPRTELRLIREVLDPKGLRDREVPGMTDVDRRR